MWSLSTARRALGRAAGLYHVNAASPRLITGLHLNVGARLSTKPPEEKVYSFKVPGHKPTDWEKKILLWGGRFKMEADIPEIVSFEMVDGAKSKVRVKVAVIMMVLTLVGCIVMVASGKGAVGRRESIARMNLEKKARLREESKAE